MKTSRDPFIPRQRRSQKHKTLRVTGGRVAYTNTTTIPNAKIESWIRFVAKHTEMDKTIVHVKNSIGNAHEGLCYSHVPDIANTNGLNRWEWRNLITMAGSGGLWLLAHEAKHVEQQRRTGRYRPERGVAQRKAGSSRVSRRGWEDAANAFANWIIDQWEAQG